MTTDKIEIGDTVKLAPRVRAGREGARTAKVKAFYADIPGGVILSAQLKGFYSWNVKDLILVKKDGAR